jgi:D-alanyl-D-alanine carboxypeptidase
MSYRLVARIVCGAIILGLVACGGSSSGGSSSSQSSLAQTVNKIVNNIAKAYQLPSISVAMAHKGVPFYSHSVGYADLANKTRAAPSQIYQIASVSKQFTATAIMQLATASPPLISLSDPLVKYFPDLNPSFDPRITIQQALTMTTGLVTYEILPQFQQWVTNGVDETTLLRTVIGQPLMFTPGSRFSYSNSNYYALAVIIERVTGETFLQYLQDKVINAANLTSTYSYLAEDSDNAIGYEDLTINSPAPRLPSNLLLGAGSMSSTVLDLCKWDWELLSGQIVPPAVVTQMTTPTGVPEFDKPTLPSTYAYGLEVVSKFERTEVFHDGTAPGFKATTATFLDTGWSIAIIVNNSPFNVIQLRDAIENAVCNPNSAFRSDC